MSGELTPNTQITQENVGPCGYLVKDFADGWYWTPNAALECTSGALVWSVADSRYETEPDRPALSPPAEDHIGDATEKVDWNVVGPKLVEALRYAVNSIEAMRPTFSQIKDEGHAYHDQVLEEARAALAAAQPEGK